MNPKDYDYLWSDHDIDFIFTSCYLFKEFRKADIILTYDRKNKALRFFLSKKDRKRLSRYGLSFYKKGFDEWKKKIAKHTRIGEGLINSKKEHDLKSALEKRFNLFQELESDYFVTEFFFMDYVEKSDDRTIRKNLKEMGKIKFLARKVLSEFYNHRIVFQPYIKRLEKLTGRKDLRWLSKDEILDLIDGKKVKVSDREKKNWILAKKTGWKLMSGNEGDNVIKDFNNYFFNPKHSILEGTIANKGYHKGKAKVIKTIFSDRIVEETKKFRKGDVLVAQTTGPELMHIIQKAGAIVTDEGGMSSHAAIVSRELNIPCIVGTKTATMMIKDGDLVEVDASKGIVKIIKN
jgi:phosphohistidine swiveling domain-containing protein